jgi:sortase (surface protein transpeptidase)
VLVSSIRRIAFGAVLLELALAGQGVASLTPPTGAALAAHAIATAAPPMRDSTTEQRNHDRFVPPPLAAPVRLLIPSLGIDAPVEALGVDSSGAMDTPHNIWNTGWYRNGPSPGATGDAVIDGHVGLPGSPLVFSGLARLALGADVVAVLADGTRSRFSVSAAQVWPANSHPPDLFSGDGQPRLSLITCTGKYDRFTQTYGDRLIVEASYVGAA